MTLLAARGKALAVLIPGTLACLLLAACSGSHQPNAAAEPSQGAAAVRSDPELEKAGIALVRRTAPPGLDLMRESGTRPEDDGDLSSDDRTATAVRPTEAVYKVPATGEIVRVHVRRALEGEVGVMRNDQMPEQLPRLDNSDSGVRLPVFGNAEHGQVILSYGDTIVNMVTLGGARPDSFSLLTRWAMAIAREGAR